MSVNAGGSNAVYTCYNDGRKYCNIGGNGSILCRIVNATGYPITGLAVTESPNSDHPYAAFEKDFRLATGIAADCTQAVGNAPYQPTYIRPNLLPTTLAVGAQTQFGLTLIPMFSYPLATGATTTSIELDTEFTVSYTANGQSRTKRCRGVLTASIYLNPLQGPYFNNQTPTAFVFYLNPPITTIGQVNVRAIAGASVVAVVDNGSSETVLIDEISDGTELHWQTSTPQDYHGQIVEIRVTGRTAHVEEIYNDPDSGFDITYFDPSFDADGDGDDDGAGQPLTADTPGSPPGADPKLITDAVDAAAAVAKKDPFQPHSSNDTTANTTKKDEYWAVRDAVEDAIGGGLSSGEIEAALGPGGLGDAGSGELELGATDIGTAGTGKGNGIAAGFGNLATTGGNVKDGFATGPGTGDDDPIGLPEFGQVDTYTLPLGPLGSTTLDAHQFDPYRGYLRRIFEMIIWIQTTLHFLGVARATANGQ